MTRPGVHRFAGERPRLLFVDGFAGPGRYARGEPGSPLIMLQALLSHPGFSRLDGVDFALLFIEHDRRRVEHLEGTNAALARLLGNVPVQVHDGEFEQTGGPRGRDGQRTRLVPTLSAASRWAAVSLDSAGIGATDNTPVRDPDAAFERAQHLDQQLWTLSQEPGSHGAVALL
jgi:hypothetical protein